MAGRGRNEKVDMLVKDIYGEDKEALDKLKLPGEIVASSFGKMASKKEVLVVDEGGGGGEHDAGGGGGPREGVPHDVHQQHWTRGVPYKPDLRDQQDILRR